MKRLVVCLDGTWNNASREVSKDGSLVFRPTNVLKIARAVRTVGDDEVAQITYYDAGVGAMNRAPDFRARLLKKVDNVLGGGWGAGFEINIEQAYTFLSNNYEPEDEVFIFGFSRGAAQARSLCRLIEWVGGFPRKRDAYYVPKLFSAYLEQRGENNAEQILNAINEHQGEEDEGDRVTINPARVRFLGVWDTVLALGWRIRARAGTTSHALAFHTSKQPPTIVDSIRHALAIDERRHDFQPEIWGPCDSLEQRWFPGAHANIGGGLIDDSLANCALKWICEEASKSGLALEKDFLRYYRANPVGEIWKKPKSYIVIDTLLQPLRGYRGVREIDENNANLDDAVLKRIEAHPSDYTPTNLLKYFSAVTRYDERLPKVFLKKLGR